MIDRYLTSLHDLNKKEPLTMLTIIETAQKYGVSIHAIRNWVKNGELPAVQTGKKFLICETVFRDFLILLQPS